MKLTFLIFRIALTFILTLKSIFIKYYLYFFKRDILMNDLKQRKGKCLQCGNCCETMFFGFKCLFFNEMTRLCRIYKLRLKVMCIMAPFSPKLTGKERPRGCGYYW